VYLFLKGTYIDNKMAEYDDNRWKYDRSMPLDLQPIFGKTLNPSLMIQITMSQVKDLIDKKSKTMTDMECALWI
jgi:hypothetical protein